MGPGAYVIVDSYSAIMFVFYVGIEGRITQIRFATWASEIPGVVKLGLYVLGRLRVHIIELYCKKE